MNIRDIESFIREEGMLKEGDIVNVDMSTIKDGYYSDSSRMFCIGEVDPEWKRLVDTTYESVQAGLAAVKPWGFLGDVSAAVNKVATDAGYTVVREFGGHGIGLEFHEDPTKDGKPTAQWEVQLVVTEDGYELLSW